MADTDHFIDASHIMNGRTQSDFYDLGHTSAEAPPVIGERIARMILSRVEAKESNEDLSLRDFNKLR